MDGNAHNIGKWDIMIAFPPCTYLSTAGACRMYPKKGETEYKPFVSCGTSRNKGNKDKAGYSRAGGAQIARSKTFWGIANAMAQQWGQERNY